MKGMTNEATTTDIPVRLDFDAHALGFSRAMGRVLDAPEET